MYIQPAMPEPYVRCCSFCGKEQRDVRLLVGANTQHHPAICNECVDRAIELMKEKET